MKLSKVMFLLSAVCLVAIVGLNVAAQQLRASSDDGSSRGDRAGSRMALREAVTYEQFSLVAGVVLLGSLGGGVALRRKEGARPQS